MTCQCGGKEGQRPNPEKDILILMSDKVARKGESTACYGLTTRETGRPETQMEVGRGWRVGSRSDHGGPFDPAVEVVLSL